MKLDSRVFYHLFGYGIYVSAPAFERQVGPLRGVHSMVVQSRGNAFRA